MYSVEWNKDFENIDLYADISQVTAQDILEKFGHPEYVKFIPLSHKDAQDILDFLKRFRYSDRVIDSPFAFRDMVDHCIMETPFF